jgi:hypothetical protein
MSEFINANLPILIERGVPPKLAEKTINLLDAQNRGELPCPLEGEDLNTVNSAWQWMTAQDRSKQTPSEV